jgi:hypothetical protein
VAEPDLLKTASSLPTPQYENDAGTGHESLGGRNRAMYATIKDALGTVLNPATQETLADLLAELQAHSQGTSVDPVVSQLSGRTIAVSLETLDSATTVAVAANETVVIQPPAGKLWILQTLYLQAPVPSGGTSGSHDFILYHGATTMPFAQGRASFDKQARYQYNEWRDNNGAALTIEAPTNKGAQQAMIRGLHLSNGVPLRVQYLNNTDVSQGGTRIIRATVVEEGIS